MSVKIYKVTQAQDRCDDYQVYVNGEIAELNSARVSSYPFNRRWPGHQRQIEQTELVSFLSLEADEEFELRIVPKRPSLSVSIRPRTLKAETKIYANGEILMKVPRDAGQFTVEPYGRSGALHVFVDPVSSYKVDTDSDNLLYFGAGEHNVGDLYLKSGQTVFIDEGAVVYATIFGLHVENVKILGRGILDNSRNLEKILYEANVDYNHVEVDNVLRENAINFVGCKNIEIDGITIRDALVYNIDAMSCEQMHFNNLKIIGCWRYNSDGVHFANCTDCSLTNSFLRTFDDSICVRGFANYEYDRFLNDEKEEEFSFVCQNILVKNCVIWNDWGKNLQVGTETYAKEIKGIVFEDCKLIHVTGMAITIWLVDNAVIHGVTFRNITVENDEYMLKMNAQRTDSQQYSDSYDPDFGGYLVNFSISRHFEYSLIKTPEELGKVSGVHLENISLYSIQKPLFFFEGDNPNSPCESVTLKNVYWNGEKISADLFKRQCIANEFAKGIEYVEE
ncbi:MAG: hypothetical protein IJY39_02985 [Clostridia bacterium]|nr:hypothetical protein [Clostridia bacterium]